MESITCGDIHMETTSKQVVAHLNLEMVAAKLPSELAVTEITQQCSTLDLSEPSSPDMDTPRVRRIDPPRSKSYRVPDSPTNPNASGKTHTARPSVSRSMSTATGTSTHHSRSTSQSNPTSRPPSRHSSLHSSRRPGTTASIVSTPARTPQQEKRESLLAFHRESCRLFQDPQSTWPSDQSTRPGLQRNAVSAHTSRQPRTSSELGSSVPPSPIASSSSSRRFDDEHRNSISSISMHMPPLNRRDRSNTLPITPSHVHSPSASSIHVPETVMEWTSTTTRRREYEKIDRASRGIHGLWRRVAPRWCQTRESRIPFFEEGKTSREGSVRRFRMDLPDEEPEIASGNSSPRDKPQVELLDFFAKNPNHSSRRLWSGRRSKTSIH